MGKKCFFTFLLSISLCFADNDPAKEGHLINFPNVSMKELVKFISRVAEVNFIADEHLLDFDVSFISGKASSKDDIVNILLSMLKNHDLVVEKNWGYYLVKKRPPFSLDEKIEKVNSSSPESSEKVQLPSSQVKKDGKFYVYKLEYHQGSEILEAIKQISNDLLLTGSGDQSLVNAIHSMQWIKSTNSLLFSGSKKNLVQICDLIKSLDTPLKQVFIEVLVIETSLGNSLDFGLQWSANSKYKDRFGFSSGQFNTTDTSPTFPQALQSMDSANGLSQIPLNNGFNLGIIGDIIFHGGKSYLSLGSLISALQTDGTHSIVLNEKILAQENKLSQIFVGDNVPFAGSLVQTIGSGQQTTANIEYRDIGISLHITPTIGNNDIITLNITEEITEAIDQKIHRSNQLSGIRTSKINMSTSAHVPDGHFLILSGMTKNIKIKKKSRIPCLGGIPLIGALFSKKEKILDKRNLLIFVKPHIINSFDEYIELSNRAGAPPPPTK